jgi:two-component system LytT family response regulator
VVDDEPKDREVLLKACQEYCTDVEVIAMASSIAEGEQLIIQHAPDLLFLDIELPDGTAFDLLHRIKLIPPKIIFFTAHEEYAVKAFRFCAVDFLLKPINFSDLLEAVRKVKETLSVEAEKERITMLLQKMNSRDKEFQKIAIHDKKGMKFINIAEIVMIKAEGSYSRVYLLSSGEALCSRSLKEYEEMLTELGIIRVHRSYLVNVKHVMEYSSDEGITLTGGLSAELGREYRNHFFNQMVVNKRKKS